MRKRSQWLNFDEANKLVDQYKYENASLVEKVKNLEDELDRSKCQLKKFSCETLDQMLGTQKYSCEKSGL